MKNRRYSRGPVLSRPHIRFDYFEMQQFKIISSSSAATLSRAVSKLLSASVSDEIPGGPSSGQSTNLVGDPFYARKQFHQAVITTHWRQVEAKLSPLAKDLQKILGDSETSLTLAQMADLSGQHNKRLLSNALDELPDIHRTRTSERRYSRSEPDAEYLAPKPKDSE